MWTLGYQQSRWSYYPESRVREIARASRERKIPADVIYLDIVYQKDNAPFTIDHFVDPNLARTFGGQAQRKHFVYQLTASHVAWWVRRELQRIFPGNDLKRLPSGHAALRSYYLLRRVGGVRIASPNLEGISIGTSTPVIYCQNDLGGAWERDQLGNWTNPCTPGGEPQRKDAFHLGINLCDLSCTRRCYAHDRLVGLDLDYLLVGRNFISGLNFD